MFGALALKGLEWLEHADFITSHLSWARIAAMALLHFFRDPPGYLWFVGLVLGLAILLVPSSWGARVMTLIRPQKKLRGSLNIQVIEPVAQRDTSMGEAIAFLCGAGWDASFFNGVVLQAKSQESIKVADQLRQLARDGAIRVWGKPDHRAVHRLIDPAEWDEIDISMSSLQTRADCAVRVNRTRGDAVAYVLLMVSRVEIERECSEVQGASAAPPQAKTPVLLLKCLGAQSPATMPEEGIWRLSLNADPQDGSGLRYETGVAGSTITPVAGYKCSIANYGEVVSNVIVSVDVYLATSPAVATKRTTLTVPQIDQGSDACFVFYISSGAQEVIHIRFNEEVRLRLLSQSGEIIARLQNTDTAALTLYPLISSEGVTSDDRVPLREAARLIYEHLEEFDLIDDELLPSNEIAKLRYFEQLLLIEAGEDNIALYGKRRPSSVVRKIRRSMIGKLMVREDGTVGSLPFAESIVIDDAFVSRRDVMKVATERATLLKEAREDQR